MAIGARLNNALLDFRRGVMPGVVVTGGVCGEDACDECLSAKGKEARGQVSCEDSSG